MISTTLVAQKMCGRGATNGMTIMETTSLWPPLRVLTTVSQLLLLFSITVSEITAPSTIMEADEETSTFADT